jgi:hypothetical protein
MFAGRSVEGVCMLQCSSSVGRDGLFARRSRRRPVVLWCDELPASRAAQRLALRKQLAAPV